MNENNLMEESFFRSERVDLVIKKAFQENREYLIEYLSKYQGNSEKEAVADPEGKTSWIGIDSLSKLRGEVGGRFDTLKIKWQDAGLPMKQKKGDEIPPYALQPAGWAELEAWLLKMGYSARLREGATDILFEIKKAL